MPKTGSDGAGFEFARRLGHTIVPTTPALVPLMLDETAANAIHIELSGVSHDADLVLWVDGRISTRLTGSLLWTHFGISGPVVLNASRHWLRADLEGRAVRLTFAGVALGLLIVAVVPMGLSRLLYVVSSHDPLTLRATRSLRA